MGLQAKVEMMTPERAANILAQSGNFNRTLNKKWVGQLSAAMARGEWRLNGEAIKLASDGALLDGQHRLRAYLDAVEMGVTDIPLLVVSGLQREVFDTLDQGMKRNASMIFQMRGEKNTAALSSALRAIPTLIRGAPFNSAQTVKQLEELLDEFPGIRFWAAKFGGSKMVRAMSSSFIVAVLTVGADKHGDEVAMDFLEKLESGTNLRVGDPALMLREKLMESKSSPSKRLMTHVAAAITVKAWNAHVAGKKVGVLRFSSDESWPEFK